MQGIRGVLFDKDGTLFDFQSSWGRATADLIAALAVTGGDAGLSGALHAALGFDGQAGLFRRDSVVIAGSVEDVRRVIAPLVPHLAPEDLRARLTATAATAEMAEAVPLSPLMTRLAGAGLRLGVATNDAEEAARLHLARAGILARFDFVAGYDSGFGAKPAPGMLLAFARAAGLAPRAVLMVGDSTHDLAAGRAAGMRTAAVLTGIAHAGDLAPLADVVLPDIGHLPRLLGLGDAAGFDNS
jgi:phosphoglycolate phosphatase